MNDSAFDRVQTRRAGAPVVAVAFAAVICGAGCGASDKKTTDVKPPQGVLPEVLNHEDCREAGGKTDALDTNSDGKPDIRRYFDSAGHEVCRIADVNHDGKPDLYEYFDASGAVRRREYCYDDTGVVNAIEYYEGGKLVRRELNLSGRHRIDTWDWFNPSAPVDAKTGRPSHPVRRERDTSGDGHVDQWWTWNGNQVSIAFDKNGDGNPDRSSAIAFGGDSGVGAGPPPPGSSPPPSASIPASPAVSDGGLR